PAAPWFSGWLARLCAGRDGGHGQRLSVCEAVVSEPSCVGEAFIYNLAMIPILTYHQIGEPNPGGTPYRGLTVHPRDLRRQMFWLRRLGYRGLSMHQLMPYVSGEKSGKVVGITFDDGYRNVLENALPILEETGFSATNYFVVRQFGG